jgi:hypothetical protein
MRKILQSTDLRIASSLHVPLYVQETILRIFLGLKPTPGSWAWGSEMSKALSAATGTHQNMVPTNITSSMYLFKALEVVVKNWILIWPL